MQIGYLIPAHGQARMVCCHTLEDHQDAVGGYIEPVYSLDRTDEKDADVQCYANEEGLLHELPTNPRATMLLGFPIVGDALFIDDSQVHRDDETPRAQLLDELKNAGCHPLKAFANKLASISDPDKIVAMLRLYLPPTPDELCFTRE